MEDTQTKRGRRIGSRQDVWDGRCERTSGGLKKDDLVFNEKSGKICTKKEVERGRKLAELMQQQRAARTPIIEEVATPDFADFQ